MKKFYLVLFSVFVVSGSAKSQYAPLLGDTTEWCIAHEVMLVLQDTSQTRAQIFEGHIIAVNDSVFGLDTFKILYSSNPVINPVGFIREDSTGKVWTIPWGSSTPVLTFDFAMNLGDTIFLDMPISTAGIFNDGNYIVDSVATFSTYQGPRKYLRLHNSLNIQTNSFGKISKLEWVESVGSLETPVYLISNSGFGTGHGIGWYGPSCNAQNLMRILVNKTTDGTKNFVKQCVFQNPIFGFSTDSCALEYFGSINESLLAINNLNAFPNPSSGEVKINLNGLFLKDQIQKIELIDVGGRMLLSKENFILNHNEIIIPAGILSDGVYVVMVKGKEKMGRAKFIITK